MPFRDTIKDYRRAANQRLSDARELMEVPTRHPEEAGAELRHLRGAVYLAGYAVECLLKAYIIHQMQAQTLVEAMDRLNERRNRQGLKPTKNVLRSAAGHEISYVVQLTDLETSFESYDIKIWGRVGAWKSAWRYESDVMSPQTAQEFLKDVEAIVNWLQPKIG